MAYPQLFVYLDQSAGQVFNEATAVDISSVVLEVRTKRGRTRLLNDFEAGTATITVADANGDFNPANTSSPYYPLLPMQKMRVKVRGSDDFTATTIWTGYLNVVSTTFSQGVASVDRVTFQCYDAFRLLNNQIITTVADSGAQLSGVRVNKILDQIGYPSTTGAREVSTISDQTTLQADPGTSRQVLQALRTVQDSEQGAFYVNAEGALTFLGRTLVINSAKQTGIVTSFDDNFYSNAEVKFDDDILINNVTVTRVGGTPQNVSNAASIAQYFTRTGDRSDILVQTDAESLYIAKTLLNVLSDVTPRIDSVSINLNKYVGSWLIIQSLLTKDLMKGVSISKQMPNGDPIVVNDVISGIEWRIANNRYDVIYYTQENTVTAFVLDDVNMGRLDYNGLGI
jgi:hypothetical protein